MARPSPWLGLSALIILADRYTKFLAETHLQQPVSLFPGCNLRLGYNPGAAWGLLADAGGWQRPLLAGISIAVSVALLVWLHRIGGRPRPLCCGLALVLGGALGNLYDRLARGMVTDFIDLYWRVWHWPTFNIADAAITVGGALILWDALCRPCNPLPRDP